MKITLSAGLLVFFAVAGCQKNTNDSYTAEVAFAIEQLRVLRGIDGGYEIGGSAVGASGEPHQVYLLQEYIQKSGTLDDFKRLLKEPNPTMRIVGVEAIMTNTNFLFTEDDLRSLEIAPKQGAVDEIWKKEIHLRKELISTLDGDPEEILVGPSGCSFQTMTVGDVIQALTDNPNYFNYEVEQVSSYNSGQSLRD